VDFRRSPPASGSIAVQSSWIPRAKVFGDAPNLAARVQSEAEPGTMLVTAAVRRGDIIAAKGDAMKAEELHGLARAKFRSLGMKRWAEGPE
jgi:class 3 adenylate cyclase